MESNVSDVPAAAAENVGTRKLRIKILVNKKPLNEAFKVSEAPEVNCVKKELSTDGGSKADASEKSNCVKKKVLSTEGGSKADAGEKVNCTKKVPSTVGGSKAEAGEKKLKCTLGTTRVIRACQLPKKVSKVNCLEKSSVTYNRITPANCSKKLNSVVGCKRASEEVLENHERKRLKMDGATTLICHNILTNLMNHERCGPFCSPVKPSVWGLDDYFDIVKKPMDLGTVKRRLQQGKYFSTEQFDADVRLTFSNSMLYNPIGNQYHESAKELLREFDKLWKPVKMKIDWEHRDTKQKPVKMERRDTKQKGFESNKIACDVKEKDQIRVSANGNRLPGKTLPDLPRRAKSCEDLKKLSVERRQIDLKNVKDDELKHKPKPSSLSSKTQSNILGPASQSACPMPAKVKCENTSRRKIEHNEFDSVRVKRTSKSQMSSYDQGSDRECHNSAKIPTTSVSVGVILTGGELSKQNPLCAAKLWERFSETIIKANNNTLLEQGGGTAAEALQKEKVMLLKRQHEERARIEARIKAVKSAAPFKTEFELKKQRQEERAAARIALERMEKSGFDDNLQVLKDLEAMIGHPLVVMCDNGRSNANTVWSQMKSDKLKSPLERLGLYIKEEYQVGNENDYVVSMDEYLEDGEVNC